MPIDNMEFFKSLMLQSQNAMSLERYEDALLIFETLEEECIQQELDEFLCSTYSAMAEIYRRQNNEQSAIKMFEKSCEACRDVLKNPGSIMYLSVEIIKENLRASLGNLADMVRDRNDYQAALPMYKEMEAVARSLNEMYWAQASLNNQGFIHYQLEEWEAAVNAYREQEIICRNERIPEELLRSLYFQAVIYNKTKDDENFNRCYVDAKKIYEETNQYKEYIDQIENLKHSNFNRGNLRNQ